MQGTTRGFANALVVALISSVLIIGALSISLVEFAPQASPTATNILLPSPEPLTATPTLAPTFTPTVGIESPTPSVTATLINTTTPPASCQPPFGWRQVAIQAGETLEIIAARYRISTDELRRANCLLSNNLVAGNILYVPSSLTNTPAVCKQGSAGWVKTYIVKPGDTFYSIASKYYTTTAILKNVNCRTSDLILAGEALWVPNVPTRTPTPTSLPDTQGATTSPPHPTEPLTETALPYTSTVLPYTATIMPNDTPMPAATPNPALPENPTVSSTP